jgi:hypothetical protein
MNKPLVNKKYKRIRHKTMLKDERIRFIGFINYAKIKYLLEKKSPKVKQLGI